MLVCSGLPHSFWPQGCSLFCEPWNRLGRPGEESTPFERRYSKPSELTLYALGQAVSYLRDAEESRYPSKFAPRGRLGVVVGYDTHRSLILLDVELFVQKGVRSLVQSRDLRIAPGPPVFPFKLIGKHLDPLYTWTFEFPFEQDEPAAITASSALRLLLMC